MISPCTQILVLCLEMVKLEIGLEHLRGIRELCGVVALIEMLCVLLQAQLTLQRMYLILCRHCYVERTDIINNRRTTNDRLHSVSGLCTYILRSIYFF